MQPSFGRDGNTALLGHRDEEAKVPQLHSCSMPAKLQVSLRSLFRLGQEIVVGRQAEQINGRTKRGWLVLIVGRPARLIVPGTFRSMSKPVVLITGAPTGIGRATAMAFAKEGARLIVTGRHDEAGQAIAGALSNLGVEAEFVRADVRREEEVRGLVARAVARFGRLDIAVNSAGTEGKPGPQTPEAYAATFDTNVCDSAWKKDPV